MYYICRSWVESRPEHACLIAVYVNVNGACCVVAGLKKVLVFCVLACTYK